jgi:hypothetical protein
LWFDWPGRDAYNFPVGGATPFPIEHRELPVGGSGIVHVRLYGDERLAPAVIVGAGFYLTEGGRTVVRGVITEILPEDTDLSPFYIMMFVIQRVERRLGKFGTLGK